MSERSVAAPPAPPSPALPEVAQSGPPVTASDISSRRKAASGRPPWRRFLSGAAVEWLAARWRSAIAGLVLVLYVLVFVRGLGWQWSAVLSSRRAVPPPVVAERPPARAAQPAAPANSAGGNAPAVNAPAGAAAPAAPAPQGAAAKVPLPPSNQPPPRNATDERGVSYDAQGVAVMGIDADPSGVYNVPPGRQVRIGGPEGQLYDVLPSGKIAPATKLKDWPS